MLLWSIWVTSAAIAAMALAGMTGLILARTVTGSRIERREAHRTALLGQLFGWLEGRVGDEVARDLLLRNRAVGTSLLIEIFELMRGEDQQRLAGLAQSARVPQYLQQAIRSRSVVERLGAAESLVWFPSDETLAALRAALEDRDDDVSLAAAGSLAELGEDLPIGRLLETRLGHGGDSSRRLEAVLVRVAPRQTKDLIRLAQHEDAAERARAAAIDALARTGSFDLVEPIASLAGSGSAAVRAAAARGLAVFAHPQGRDAAVALLSDSDWEVRAEAAEAIGRIGLLEAVDDLAALLDDENWWVRFRAGEALASLGEQGITRLKEIAASHRSLSGQMAGLVLAERGLT